MACDNKFLSVKCLFFAQYREIGIETVSWNTLRFIRITCIYFLKNDFLRICINASNAEQPSIYKIDDSSIRQKGSFFSNPPSGSVALFLLFAQAIFSLVL